MRFNGLEVKQKPGENIVKAYERTQRERDEASANPPEMFPRFLTRKKSGTKIIGGANEVNPTRQSIVKGGF